MTRKRPAAGTDGRLSPGMKTDNPIEDVWRIREEIAAENGYDVDRLFDAMEREQAKYADRLVYHVPRRASEESSAVLREDPPNAG